MLIFNIEEIKLTGKINANKIYYMMQILKVLVILAIAQQSHQAYLAPRQAAVVSVLDKTWRGLPMDWNHDGIIDWRDRWGWNNGIGGDWDLSNGIIESWKEGKVVPSNIGDKRNLENDIKKSTVVLRLKVKSDTTFTLKNNQIKNNAKEFLGTHFKYYNIS